MNIKKIFIVFGFVFSFFGNAQVGVGTTSPHSSAILDINASDKGFLIPRLSLSSVLDQTTILSPAAGLMIYNQKALTM